MTVSQKHETGGRRSGYISCRPLPPGGGLGFKCASSSQGIPASRPGQSRRDLQPGCSVLTTRPHTAPQPIEAPSLQPARLDAREDGSHHSPRPVQSQQRSLCACCSARKIVMFERTSSSPCEAVQQTSLERVTIEIAGARVTTNRVRTSPTSSLDTGRCVAMPRRDALPAPPHWSHSAAVASLGLHTAAAACIQLHHLATSRVPLKSSLPVPPFTPNRRPCCGG